MRRRCRNKSEIAFLWDESFLWGLMAYDSLNSLGLPFNLVTSDEIKKGILREYKLLFVPGGWASNKIKALEEDGIEEIRRFVYKGGNYFGICGGAGLATAEGIGLLNIKRKPTKERVPSFSGPINLNIQAHPIWDDIESTTFYAWWPSQFVINDRDINILATFGDALPEAFSSDLNVGDIESSKSGWEELEGLYRINLDPKRLKDEPAVVEGHYGKGKVLLSLIHFDTPSDKNGSIVLKSLWRYLSGAIPLEYHRGLPDIEPERSVLKDPPITKIEEMVEDLVQLGIRNFLWFWRTPTLLQWRRGVRGLEYCTLYVMAKRVAMAQTQNNISLNDFTVFYEKAKRLLILERKALQKEMLTFEYSPDKEIQILREELFGNSKSHGGLFKRILNSIDKVLYDYLTKPQK